MTLHSHTPGGIDLPPPLRQAVASLSKVKTDHGTKRGNIPAANKFDLLGRTLYTNSCDAGARWSFTNVVGNPIRVWDSRDHVIRSVYDDLHRRTELWVKAGSADEILAEQTIYGEGQTDPEVSNLRGKVYQVKDGAGVLTNVSYDFKGNLLSSQRQLAVAYSTQLDWSDTVTLETETFVQTTQYDALNRPTSITMPDLSEILPIYNEAGLLESVTAHVRGATGLTTFVDDIDYDAKGQREKIVYGNGVYTEYSYDPETYRVKRMKTTRDSDDEVLQDLRYHYDAVGNIVEVADLAHETFYHGGHEIKAVWQYEYDALYRLTYATGREHVGTNDDIQQDENGFPLVNGANPNDPSAMRNYEESFEYDQVGNILKMIHDAQSSVGDWTRHYHIAETSNRLLDTSLPGDDEEDAVYSAEYTHDAHGNMLTMPHLSDGIEWDFKDQMRHVDKGGGGDVYFVYDASGQRIRKVWEHSGIIEERIYLGGFELYRRHELGDVVLERETLHIMDDQQRIAMVETKTIDEAADPFTITPRFRYQLGNHLGSAMLELDHEGLVISYEEYHPYGTSAYRAVDDSIEVSAKRYRYTGKERDEETGLYYHGARYYACWLGRWTSADPAGMVDGVNLYQYVRGNPLRFVDPNGAEAFEAMSQSLRDAWSPCKFAHHLPRFPNRNKSLRSASSLRTTCRTRNPNVIDNRVLGNKTERSEVWPGLRQRSHPSFGLTCNLGEPRSSFRATWQFWRPARPNAVHRFLRCGRAVVVHECNGKSHSSLGQSRSRHSLGARCGFSTGLGLVSISATSFKLTNATIDSFENGTLVPMAKQVVREARGWAGPVAGAKLGAAGGAALGISRLGQGYFDGLGRCIDFG